MPKQHVRPRNRPFTFGSLCSGIEAATVAWSPLGWHTAFVAETNKFCNHVLAHHYPTTPNLYDITRIRHRAPLLRFAQSCRLDLLAAGTPCQDLSVAGSRGGIRGSRSSLALEFIHLLRLLQPRWVFWENVPGVLSSWSDAQESEETRGPVEGWEQSDFDLFLSLLEDCGYGVAYRVLDGQYAGLAQRRERVFVVGCHREGAGDRGRDWRAAAAVLFDEESLRGDFKAGGEKGEGATMRLAPSLTNSGRGVERTRDSRGQDPVVVAYGDNNTSGPISVATACNAKGGSGRMDFESETLIAHTLKGEGADGSEDGTGRGVPLITVPDTYWYNESNASPQETHTREILRVLRGEVGEEVFSEWGSGVLNYIFSTEILQSDLLRSIYSREAKNKQSRLDGLTSESPDVMPAWALYALWKSNGVGCSSQRRKLAEQRTRQLGKNLPKLSSENSQKTVFMRSLWCSSEGIGVLRETLSKIQKTWESETYKNKSVQQVSRVRRLTPREAERLMGFPDDYTLIPTYRSRQRETGPAALTLNSYYSRTPTGRSNVLLDSHGRVWSTPDGPRYKSLGNSWAVPEVRYLGSRIALIDEMLDNS